MKNPSPRRLTSALHIILLVGLVIACLSAAAIVAGPAGFGWFGDEPAISGDATVEELHVDARLNTTLRVLATESTSTGDAIAIETPASVHFEIDDPSTVSRVVWVGATVIGPLVAAVGLWLVLGIVRSTRTGQPFTQSNERRLWTLASVVAIGGTVASMAGDFARTFVLQRSELADFFAIEATLSFLPILAGITIGVLAGVWRIGVSMSHDLTGTI